jgi:UPF0755 protein
MSNRESGRCRKAILIVALASLLTAIVVGAFWIWANAPIRIDATETEFVVEPGTGFRQVTGALHDAGVQVAEMPFRALGRLAGVTTRIRAGTYLVRSPITPRELLRKLSNGEVLQVEVTIPEGWTFRQLRTRLDAHPGLRHDTVGMPDADLLRAIGAAESNPEGLFFPDTYRVDKGAPDTTVLRAAYQRMSAVLSDAWRTRDPEVRLRTPYEALILASIVEKETGRPEDRPIIASVFHNRLRIGMRLQTDPTVIYGLGPAFDGNLRKRDLLADSPYNTYTRAGLPPGPIALPGREAIAATLRPPPSPMLYFVARGDGSSAFSANLEAHNRAVDRYQRGIR